MGEWCHVVWLALMMVLIWWVKLSDGGWSSNNYPSEAVKGEDSVVVYTTGPLGEDGDQKTEQHYTPRSSYPMCRMGFRIRDYYPTQDSYYQNQTCFWCYHFVPAHRRSHNLQIVREVITLDDNKPKHLYDYMFKAENETYHFNPDSEAWEYVVESMLDVLEAHKVEECCRDAMTCCQQALDDLPGDPGDCPRTWDGWTCFSDTPPGSTVTFTCPHIGYKGYPECAMEGRKECWENGTWAIDSYGVELTDYSSCSHKQYHLTNYYWEASMHVLSILTLLPAIFLILFYRQLRIQRMYLHLNFFFALLGKAFFNLLDALVLRVPEYTGTNTLVDDNTGGCKLLVFLAKMFGLAVWTWMLAESIYLHRLIVAAFKGGGKTYVYLIIGWVPAVVLSVVWAVCRAVLEDYQCWLGDDANNATNLFLITELPKMFIIIVNTVLLANTTRVLLTKLRGVNNDNSTATRTAVKATAFLLPMFGLQFFITFYIPSESHTCTTMQVYMFIAMGLDGLQGFYVAIVYCFLNKEVKLQVRRSVYHLRGRMATEMGTATYDPRTDVSLLHSGAVNSVATTASVVD
ncbi:corticotropin-releasing factor receptor 1-like isoform X1 [Homarus americanus]|nr:corticotropin-releasing factor receptor 1-like isoform X1 [Homarus americanus]XP_042226937.1 corticotropin-releasing factor receptor 1-like isoform X1 [Homarus americanus]XP_042226938.1 corticotropin-releasing factor receptor 1-like isoform X1 [Homarus americanus]